MNRCPDVIEYKTLGQMLKGSRCSKKISIEELSSITKIHKTLIHSLENDEYLNLPNRIYVLGFLKSISEALDINLNTAVEFYEDREICEEVPPPVITEEALPEKVVSFEWPLFFKNKKTVKVKWLAAIVGFILSILFISPLLIEKNRSVTDEPNQIQKYIVKRKVASQERSVVIEGSLRVGINAKYAGSWITFKVDKNPIRRLNLKKGTSIVLIGEKIKLTLGNHKAFEVLNNNVVVDIPQNKKNKVINLAFPQKKTQPSLESDT